MRYKTLLVWSWVMLFVPAVLLGTALILIWLNGGQSPYGWSIAPLVQDVLQGYQEDFFGHVAFPYYTVPVLCITALLLAWWVARPTVYSFIGTLVFGLVFWGYPALFLIGAIAFSRT